MLPGSLIERKFSRFGTGIAPLILILMMAGCNQGVLNIFFTGVPEPGAKEVIDPTSTDATGTVSDAARKKPNFVLQIQDFVHGPFGAVACDLCHLDPDKRSVGTAAQRSTPRPGQQLAYPSETLCVGCHSEMAAARVAAEGLWQHGPVASGWCVTCHNPHKTKRQYMLVRENNVAMCGQCHLPDALQATAQHSVDASADCIGCHNPHAGRSRLLLRAEYDERRRYGGS